MKQFNSTTMAKYIKMAPDVEEITRQDNVFECDFNDMHIKWCIAADLNSLDADNERKLKEWLQTAIGMSGKLWQVPFLLNKNLPFASEVFINDEKVEYPKD